MEFWGVEVKAGEPLKVQPQPGRLIHISQAALGEVKNAKEAKYVPLRLKVDSKNFVIGSLDAENRPQSMFDLVFEKEFELSHDWKNGSVYFIGYTADDLEEGKDDFSSEEDSEELEADDLARSLANVGNINPKKASALKAEVSDEDEESDSDDGDSDDSDPEDELDSSSEEELPQVPVAKKRPAPSAQQSPAPKKAKPATADKKGNQNGNAATPVPSKAVGKSPKSFNKSNSNKSKSKAKQGGK